MVLVAIIYFSYSQYQSCFWLKRALNKYFILSHSKRVLLTRLNRFYGATLPPSGQIMLLHKFPVLFESTPSTVKFELILLQCSIGMYYICKLQCTIAVYSLCVVCIVQVFTLYITLYRLLSTFFSFFFLNLSLKYRHFFLSVIKFIIVLFNSQ